MILKNSEFYGSLSNSKNLHKFEEVSMLMHILISQITVRSHFFVRLRLRLRLELGLRTKPVPGPKLNRTK